jgi:hypothetical protein
MRQLGSTAKTTYKTIPEKKPKLSDGYPQRIEIWDALQDCEGAEGANRNDVLAALQSKGCVRPRAALDIDYVRIELTDMCKRGFIRRILF